MSNIFTVFSVYKVLSNFSELPSLVGRIKERSVRSKLIFDHNHLLNPFPFENQGHPQSNSSPYSTYSHSIYNTSSLRCESFFLLIFLHFLNVRTSFNSRIRFSIFFLSYFQQLMFYLHTIQSKMKAPFQ